MILQHSFQVNSDSSRAVTCIALSGLGVWISLQNSAVVRLFHAMSYEPLCDVNVAPAVTKMLASKYTRFSYKGEFLMPFRMIKAFCLATHFSDLYRGGFTKPCLLLA